MLPWIFGPHRARSIAAGIATATVAFCVSLVAAEFAVRLAFADITTTSDNRSYFAQRWRENLSSPNSLGFREREVVPERSRRLYRIAVIGDSFTWGQGIERSDRLTERLEGLLKSSSRHFEVLNFGRAGAETVHHVQTLRDVVLDLQPDFVLMQWFVNDGQGDDKSGRPVAVPLVPSKTASNWLRSNSALYYLINSQWVKLQQSLGLLESYEEYLNRRFADPASPDTAAAQQALKEFISIARDAHVGVGIVAFPRGKAESVQDFPLGYLIDRVMHLCVVEKITCIDLREVFAGVADSDGWWANRLDDHPGPLANKLAAEAVAAIFGESWGADPNAQLLKKIDVAP